MALGDYFLLGEGLEATVHVQTLDGVESFEVDGAISTSGSNFIRFNIPSALSTLLNGISIGDRFIFAITAPVVSAFTGDAEPINVVVWRVEPHGVHRPATLYGGRRPDQVVVQRV